ncbi:MAG: hypothetical protein ACRCVJ_00970 [Clostridium sp.]|uniref:hypothetical protein n=1 Tax=Clostridium sp. TaxID=1506 RepID=UPI003F3F26B9
MNIESLEKVCNKRNCVERILFENLCKNDDINELVLNYLNHCKLNNLNGLVELDDNTSKKIIAYSTYANILNNYVRRDNVSYQNMHQILKMLDKSKDTIRFFFDDINDTSSLDVNFDEFISWSGISYSFDEVFKKIINVEQTSKYLQQNLVI